ncbi:MAG TPA: aspartyl protease family protein [Parvularculaceae bacterium]|nr:aspartyl protease family protein [Parvularculaceae bacterium]
MRIWALLLVWALTAAKLCAAEPIATLPYRIDYDGAIVVDATINGKGPYDFMIDTGATLTFVFENAAADQNFQPTGGAQIRVLGLVRTGLLPPYRLGDIALGGAILPDHVGVIVPDWSNAMRTPQGVIGLDFLKKYAVYFNHDQSTMSIYPAGGLPAALREQLKTVDLYGDDFKSASQMLYVTDASAGAQNLKLILDLGASTTLVNYAVIEKLYEGTITFSPGGSRIDARINDIFGDKKNAKALRLRTIRAGRARWRDRIVLVYDPPIFNALGVRSRPYGLLGADLLIDRDFALDIASHKLFVAPRPGRRS